MLSVRFRDGYISTTPKKPRGKDPRHLWSSGASKPSALGLSASARTFWKTWFCLTVHHGCWALQEVQKGWKTNEMYTKVWQFLVSVVFLICNLWTNPSKLSWIVGNQKKRQWQHMDELMVLYYHLKTLFVFLFIFLDGLNTVMLLTLKGTEATTQKQRIFGGFFFNFPSKIIWDRIPTDP